MKTIAIIEDDVHIGNLMEEAMGQEQYQVLRAYSGTEASTNSYVSFKLCAKRMSTATERSRMR
jgi:DNA-binding NtrC family response regulator